MSLDTGTGQVPARAANEAQPGTPPGTPNILELLDAMGLDFVLHTHHPLTHIEAEDEALAATGTTNVRLECNDPPPMGIPSGILFSN